MENGTRKNTAQGGNRTNHSVRSRKRQHGRLRKLIFMTACIAAALVVALVCVWIAYYNNQKPEETSNVEAIIDDGRFIEGVHVNGMSLAGKTYDEARQLLLPAIEESKKQVSITILYSSALWVLTSADMGVTSDIDEVLQEAIMLGRGGTRIENADEIEDVNINGRELFTKLLPNDDKLAGVVAGIGAAIDTAPVEPSAVADAWSEEPAFSFSEGSEGHMLNGKSLCEQIKTKIENGDYTAELSPELETVEPTMTMDDVKANAQLIATFQTDYGTSSSLKHKNRIANILKAANLLKGAAVAPGTEFSFNDYIGPRTEIGGWPLAPGIVNGNTYENQAGGGICQVSTTLYNTLLLCGPEIEVTVREHHSWPSSYVPYGLDATVSTGGPDLAFKNNSDSTIYIFAKADNENYIMTVWIYGKPLEAGVSYNIYSVIDEEIPKPEVQTVEEPTWPTGFEKVEITGRAGYRVTAYRDKLIQGEIQSTETLYQDYYRAKQGVIHVGTGDASIPKPTTFDW